MKQNMSVLNQIGAGLVGGFAISFVLGLVVFQADLFSRGAQSIGVSLFGFCYFFGGLAASLILWRLAKGHAPAKYLGFFAVAIVVVGSIGMHDLTTGVGGGNSLNLNIEEYAQFAAKMFFWGVPAAMVILYSLAVWSANE